MQGNVKDGSAPASQTSLTPREAAAWEGFLRAHTALYRVFDAELQQKQGVTINEAKVLTLLSREQDMAMRMSDLAEAIDLSASGMTRLVERLERRGLARRESCPSDRRGHLAVLTEEGSQLVGAVQVTRDNAIRERFLRHVPDEDLDRLVSFWSRLTGEQVSGDPDETCTGIPATRPGT